MDTSPVKKVLDDCELWLPIDIPKAPSLFAPPSNLSPAHLQRLLPSIVQTYVQVELDACTLPGRCELILGKGLTLSRRFTELFVNNLDIMEVFYRCAVFKAWCNNLGRHMHVYNQFMKEEWPLLMEVIIDEETPTFYATYSQIHKVQAFVGEFKALCERVHTIFDTPYRQMCARRMGLRNV